MLTMNEQNRDSTCRMSGPRTVYVHIPPYLFIGLVDNALSFSKLYIVK